jgi:hypothetical protein
MACGKSGVLWGVGTRMVLKKIVGWTRSPILAGLLQAAFYLFAAVWLIGVLGAAAWAWMNFDLPEIERLALLAGAVLVGATGVTLFGTWGELYGQQGRDVSAQRVYDALRRGDSPAPYTVYLRPFASTGEISDIGVGAPTAGAGANFAGVQIELEEQIERALRPLGRLVALGQPLEHIGAGRIPVGEEEWRDAIRLLLSKARLIVMLPSASMGTLEEVTMLIDTGLIERTVLIDPPNLRRSRKFNQAAEWDRVREAFSARGFSIPDDSRAGLLLFFGAERAPKLKERLDIDAEDRVERLFRRVIRITAAKPARA